MCVVIDALFLFVEFFRFLHVQSIEGEVLQGVPAGLDDLQGRQHEIGVSMFELGKDVRVSSLDQLKLRAQQLQFALQAFQQGHLKLVAEHIGAGNHNGLHRVPHLRQLLSIFSQSVDALLCFGTEVFDGVRRNLI
eukprot:Skav200428  [mRNA]  locus=scaffold578:35875:38939:+ [translate_table: standard]